jgi:uncharacterized repeat protein (TIGR02543 family)
MKKGLSMNAHRRLLTLLLMCVMTAMMTIIAPVHVQAASNSTVVLHPSAGHTVTGVKVSVGDKIDGHPVTSISGYDITVDLGKYNVYNDSFRLPYAADIWSGVDDNKVDYISWAGGGGNQRSEGASALLVNGKNTAYYFFKGAVVYPTFTLNYHANGGTGAPGSQTYTASNAYEKSHTFTISSTTPTRSGYDFLGWAETAAATTATGRPGGSINVTGTTTLYAVWQKQTTQPETYTVTYTDGVDGVEVFADQVYNDCAAGSSTPAFVGTPARDGYTFTGWSPTVAETVTGDATYVAQWEKSGGEDPDPETFTVTYTDGVDGVEVFADQVYSDCAAGSSTPAFAGTPARDGYTFKGWNPTVAATVTGDATYVAQWEKKSSGGAYPSYPDKPTYPDRPIYSEYTDDSWDSDQTFYDYKSPKTGDSSRPEVWFVLMFLSLGALITILYKRAR